MLLKLLLIVLVTVHSLVAAEPKQKSAKDRVAAVLIKDSENGELRFLTNPSSVNQLITQKQDVLEQLRPSDGTNNNYAPIIIDLNGGGSDYTSPTYATSTSTGDANSAVLAAAASNSPIAELLPQIVGQAVANGAATGLNRRRRIRPSNKRRRVNSNSIRRRRRRRPGNKPQVIYVRPQNG